MILLKAGFAIRQRKAEAAEKKDLKRKTGISFFIAMTFLLFCLIL